MPTASPNDTPASFPSSAKLAALHRPSLHPPIPSPLQIKSIPTSITCVTKRHTPPFSPPPAARLDPEIRGHRRRAAKAFACRKRPRAGRTPCRGISTVEAHPSRYRSDFGRRQKAMATEGVAKFWGRRRKCRHNTEHVVANVMPGAITGQSAKRPARSVPLRPTIAALHQVQPTRQDGRRRSKNKVSIAVIIFPCSRRHYGGSWNID